MPFGLLGALRQILWLWSKEAPEGRRIIKAALANDFEAKALVKGEVLWIGRFEESAIRQRIAI